MTMIVISPGGVYDNAVRFEMMCLSSLPTKCHLLGFRGRDCSHSEAGPSTYYYVYTACMEYTIYMQYAASIYICSTYLPGVENIHQSRRKLGRRNMRETNCLLWLMHPVSFRPPHLRTAYSLLGLEYEMHKIFWMALCALYDRMCVPVQSVMSGWRAV